MFSCVFNEYFKRIGICICDYETRLELSDARLCVLNLMINCVRNHDLDDAASLLSPSKCPIGSFRSIPGIGIPVFPPAETAERNQ